MSPVTHFLTGWAVAHAADLGRRDQALVTLSVVVPDVDGLGIVAEMLTRNSAHPLLWFSHYHHSLHNLAFAVVIAASSSKLVPNTSVAANSAVCFKKAGSFGFPRWGAGVR